MSVVSWRRRVANSRLGKVTRVIGAVLSVGVLAAFVVLNWPASLGGRANWAVVSGTSMLPNYQTGDMILTWRTETWGIGDNVLYSVDGTRDALIFHRLIGGNAERGWRAQGDNNPEPDPIRIPDENILGVELFKVPGAGFVLAATRQPIVVIALIAGGLVWYVLMAPGRKRRLERYPVDEPASVAGIAATVKDMHAEGARFLLESDRPLELESVVPVEVWVLDGEGQRHRVSGMLTIRYDYVWQDVGRSVGGPVVWASADDVDRIMRHVREYVLRDRRR